MMTIKRAKRIIDSYGGHFEQWPVDERLALQQLLSSNVELLQAKQHALFLDDQLDQYFSNIPLIETEQLQQKILMALADRKKTTDSRASNKRLRISDLFAIESVLTLFNNPARTMGVFALLILVCSISLFPFNTHHQKNILVSNPMENEIMLMADFFEYSDELELLAILEPELLEDDSDIL